MQEHNVKRTLAICLILLVFAFVGYALFGYLSALFGSLVLFVLLRPLHVLMTQKLHIPVRVSSVLALVVGLFVLVVPIAFAGYLLVGEVQSMDFDEITHVVDRLNDKVPFFDLRQGLEDAARNMLSYAQNFVLGGLGTVTHIILLILVAFFLTYFLLVHEKKLVSFLFAYSPFKRSNTEKLVKEFVNVTYSGVISTGIIAIIQGSLVTLGFLIFDIANPVFWGFISTILSVLPIIGAPIIWIPAGIIQISLGNYFGGIGILLWGGILVSNIDNVLRPIMGQKIGSIHPVISLMGVLIGVPYFSLMGIIIGPLLLSYFFILVQMFKEEYVERPYTYKNSK